MELTFEQKKSQLQKFYDDWVKPVESVMSPEMRLDMEETIVKYSLTR